MSSPRNIAHHTLMLVILFSTVFFMSDVHAKKVVTEAIKMYSINGSNVRLDTKEGVIAQFEANWQANYSRCLTKNQGGTRSYFCQYHYVTSTAPHPTLGQDFTNGETTYHSAETKQFITYFDYQGSSSETNDAGSLGITVDWQCPSATGGLTGSVTGSSGPANDKTVWCERIEEESCSVENPIDIFSGTKFEYAVDYISPNGTLKVDRRYLNQNSGWVTNMLPQIKYVAAGQSVETDNLFPQSSGSCIDVAGQRLVKYKDPVNDPGVMEVYTKKVCPKMLNKEESDMIYVWLNGKEYRLFEGNGTFLPEGGFKGGLKVEAVNDIAGAAWKMTNKDHSISYFNQQGRILKTLFPQGGDLSYEFTGDLLMRQSDHSGRALQYQYNDNNRLSSVTLPNGEQINYSYVDNEDSASINYWLINKVTWPDGATKEYSYNEPDKILYSSNTDSFLTGKYDAYGNRIGTYHYYQGKAVSTEGFGGANKAEVVKKRSYYVQFKDSLGTDKTWYFKSPRVDGEKLLYRKKQAAGSGSPGAYLNNYFNDDGQLTQEINYNGNRTQFDYDLLYKYQTVKVTGIPSNQYATYTAVGATLPLGASKTSTQWNANISSPIRIAEPGKLTTMVYQGQPDPFDNNNLANCTVASEGHTSVVCRRVEQATTDDNGSAGFSATLDLTVNARQLLFSYNQHGKLLTVKRPTDAIHLITNEYAQDATYTHNVGDLKSTINALGHRVEYLEYDLNGNPTKIQDTNGSLTLLAYDQRGRVNAVDFEGQITTFTYDLNGNLQSITPPNGSTITREYDGVGRLSAVVDGLYNRQEYSYDLAGNLLSNKILNAGAQTTFLSQYQYDALGRLQKSLGNNGQTNDKFYDKEGNQTRDSNALGHTTSASFDAHNRVKETIDADTGKTKFIYDNSNRLTSVTDAEGKTTGYEYNAFGDLTQLTSPDTGITTFTYDAASNMLTKTDARGVTATFTYDALNRLLTQSYTDPSEDIAYSYDDTTNGNKGMGRLTSVTDQTGTTSYEYNRLGQISKETRIINGNTYVTEYHFDANGQQTGMTYPSGRMITYSFDELARVSGMTSTHQMQITTLASNIGYLPFGSMSSLTYGNGNVLTQSFDLDYRLTDKSTTGLHLMSYGYDVTDNITSITGNLDSNNTQNFSYDKLSRLLNSNGEYGSLGFTYDKIGNRLSKTDNGSVDTYAYTADSHRLESITGDNAKSFTHDEIGNTLTKDGLTFSYNQQGRLQSASKTGMNAAYFYSFKGERSLKQVDGVTTHFIYDMNGQLISEADSNGAITKEYIYLNGQRLASIDNGSLYYVHTDHLGTPIALTDDEGIVQWKAHYTPFGIATVEVDNLSQAIRFPGQYLDQETGLHYNYFRDYDPEIGRYLQSDPIGLAGGLNTYVYVGGNPVNFVDPLGLFIPQLIGALVNTGFEGYNQYQSGDLHMGKLAVAAATGALGGFGSTALKALATGASGGAINNAYHQLEDSNSGCGSDFDSSEVLRSAAFGALGGGLGYGAGALGSNLYRPVDVIGRDLNTKIISSYGSSGAAVGAAGGTSLGNQ